MNPFCVSGAKHLFKSIELARRLPGDIFEIVQRVIQRNGYFAHSENILLTMLNDGSETIRQLAYDKIEKIRSMPPNIQRKFIIPKIDFDAPSYFEMKDSTESYEPPSTRKISLSILKDNICDLDCSLFPKFKLHTQAVERCVKMVTKSASTVYGHSRRDGSVRLKIDSQRKRSKFDSKKDYK